MAPSRIAIWVVLLALLVIAIAIVLSHKGKWSLPASLQTVPQPSAPANSSTPPGSVTPPSETQVKGKLEIRKPARDVQLGVTADAAVLLRIVEMYQWHEHCGLAAGPCSYDAAWSSDRIDSSKFRVPEGHRNPPAPFADASFVAPDIRLGDLIVDAKLLDGQPTRDYPVSASALPPNLAATFSVIDGALFAGGDAAHPQVGSVRVHYRVIAPGEVELHGIKRGNRLDPR